VVRAVTDNSHRNRRLKENYDGQFHRTDRAGQHCAGFEVADIMLKTADVELVLSRSICSGKYMVLIRATSPPCRPACARVARSAISPSSTRSPFRTSTRRFSCAGGTNKVEALEALGIIESFSIASLIEAADAAVKSANITLIEIRLAMALRRKSFRHHDWTVADVTTAVEAGAAVVAAKGC